MIPSFAWRGLAVAWAPGPWTFQDWLSERKAPADPRPTDFAPHPSPLILIHIHHIHIHGMQRPNG